MPLEPSHDVAGGADVVTIRVRVAAEDINKAPLLHAADNAGSMPESRAPRSRAEASGAGFRMADSAIGSGVADRRKCGPPSRLRRFGETAFA